MTLEIQFQHVTLRKELEFPMMAKQMTVQETKEYHRKKYYELSLKTVGQLPQLEKPTYEQKSWVLRKLKRRSFY